MKWARLFAKYQPLKKGLYHFRGSGDLEGMRFHLRIEEDAESILTINASKILYLNKTATEYVYELLQGKSNTESVKDICKRYNVKKKIAMDDYLKLKDTLKTISTRDDVCPITYLGVEPIAPFQKTLHAPYRMDLALTYRCNNDCKHCYVARTKDIPELKTETWIKIIDKLWSIGIPHHVFTGGEATTRDDLPKLIAHAEDLGIITGLLTNGRRLANKDYINELVDVGIDYIQITLESHDKDMHNTIVGCDAWAETVQGIKNAVGVGTYVLTNTTLTTLNARDIEKTIEFIHSLGITTFACNSLIYTGRALESSIGISEENLTEILKKITHKAQMLGMRFIWYTPTQYCKLNPIDLALGPKQCSAAKINMCIEPNGDVLPCQSYYEPLGNILNDDWETIWNNPICNKIRTKAYAPEKCRSCEEFSLCGGGCPLYLTKDTTVCMSSTTS